MSTTMRISFPTSSPPPARTRLTLENLEARDVPAITIQLDYSFDTHGFFADPVRRAVLQQVADDVGANLSANLPAIVPGGGNTWSATFFNPATGQEVRLNNPTVPADTLVIYAGGRDLVGVEAGLGGYGGYGAGGSQAWLDSIRTRGPAGMGLWGGALAFDTNGTNWYFGTSIDGIGPTQIDFYTVATHELGLALGFGTAPRWRTLTSTGAFTGPAAQSLYGGPVPLGADGDHWADGITINGQPVAMDPYVNLGTRTGLTSLDYAALQDLGWAVGRSGAAPDVSRPAFTPVPQGNPGATPVVLTGPTDGSAQAYYLGANNTLVAAGARHNPFPGYTGVIRSTVADFNGDGVPDFAFATGAGVAAQIRIFDGKTGADLVRTTTVLDGFTGGVFLAAGDVDRDGKAELVVSADAGGSTRVALFRVEGGRLATMVDFLAFDSPEFRGGSRVGMGDINRDGAADLIVGAGVGGGPRVSIYDGKALADGRLVRLVPDFFALDGALRSGVYVSVADLDGDGYADIAYSTGDTGGPRVRVVSGAVLVAHPGADVATLTPMADFFALDPDDRKGIRITTKDVDGDGRAELIVGSGDRTRATVRVIPLGQMNVPTTSLQNPFADPLTIDGVYVG